MYLVIDIGNTNTKFAIFSKIGSKAHLNEPEIIMIQGEPDITFLAKLFDDNPAISKCILSSVINHDRSINELLNQRFDLLIMTPAVPLPVINKYQTPETLGNDRIAAAVGGRSLFPGKDVLVINAGTCITYEFITSQGEYLGGAISPGMQMRFKALHTFTDKLPLISSAKTDHITGNSTESSILSGVMEGMTAEIEGIVAKYMLIYPQLQVVFSGGDLNYFVKRLKINIFAFPNIVIYGLHKILEFNVKSSA